MTHPAAELRELLDRLTGLEEAAAKFDGHNEMACHEIGETTDAIFEVALHMDECVVHRLGAIGMILPGIVLADDEEERWELMNNALTHVLVALEHVEDLVGDDQNHHH